MFYLIKKLLGIKWKKFKVKKHKLETYEIDKISLSCFDDKRYVLDDGIHTLSYFHKNKVSKVVIIKKNVIILLMIIDNYCWLLLMIIDYYQ